MPNAKNTYFRLIKQMCDQTGKNLDVNIVFQDVCSAQAAVTGEQRLSTITELAVFTFMYIFYKFQGNINVYLIQG